MAADDNAFELESKIEWSLSNCNEKIHQFIS